MRGYPEIDGIRGVLSLIVVAGHVVGIVHWPEVYGDGESPLYWYWGCMEVFFCISGFLITRNLLSNVDRVHWIKHYLIRRALRIWPAYYAALAVSIAVSLYVPQPPAPQDLRWNQDWGYLLKTLFFLQYTEHYWQGESTGAVPVFGHSWSVAMEEQFYLLILLLVWLRVRTGLFPGYRPLLLVLALLPFSLVMRHLGFSVWTLAGRGEGFLFGIALAFMEPAVLRVAEALRLRNDALRATLSYALCAVSLVFLVPYFWTHGNWEKAPKILHVGPTNPHVAFAFFAFVLLLSVVAAPVTWLHSALRVSALRYLGEISYSTYLFHIPVLFVLYYLLDRASMLGSFWILGPIVVIGVASLTYRFVERPFLLRKKHYK